MSSNVGCVRPMIHFVTFDSYVKFDFVSAKRLATKPLVGAAFVVVGGGGGVLWV